MSWYGWSPMSGWGWVVTTLSGLVLLALVAALVARAVRPPGGTSSPPTSSPPPQTAEHLLADRFARGEIDETEYRRRLTTLRSAGTGPEPG
ncbi:SHOCT domain-containing protein [Geodermatophilus sp. SYSU D00965]